MRLEPSDQTTIADLIKRSMAQATQQFYDAFADDIVVMIHQGYTNNILHNPRLVMYKMMGRTRNGITIEKGTERKISGVINVMKYQGYIKNHWTIDTTRSINTYNSFDGKKDGLNTLADSFYLDRWKNQPMKIILMCEASGYLGVIKNIADDFRVPYVPAKGDMSVQLKMEVAYSITEPTIILYYGDYDKKGIQIPKTIEGDIRAINPDADFTLVRMFLNEDHIIEYGLDIDSKGQVQLEQLEENIAINMSKEYIRGIIDEDAWNACIDEERSIRQQLTKEAELCV